METIQNGGEKVNNSGNGDWLVNKNNPTPVPEFRGAQQESKPSFNRENTTLSFYRDGHLRLGQTGFSVDLVNKISGLADDSITAIKFTTPKIEYVDEGLRDNAVKSGLPDQLADAVSTKASGYDEHLYFVGEIKDFEDVKSEFKDPEEAVKEFGDMKFAVSYDGDGIADVKPIGDDVVVHPLKDKEALYSTYEEITGQKLIAENGE